MLPNLKKWAFFYFSPDFSPEQHTVMNTNESGTCTFITVGFDPSAKENNQILDVATQLVEEGVQAIELCGGFGPEWAIRLKQVLPESVPIGSVMYGPEYRQALLDIMKP